MRNLLYGRLLLALIGITVVGCKKENLMEENINSSVPQTENSEMGENMKLGKQLENPYSVENMQKAYDNLNSKRDLRQKSNLVIEATHYYVSYLPNSEEELEALKNDTTLELFDYPLDFEILQNGIHYHDPSISIDQITWQYCVVEKDYQFQSIQHEILADLYIPELLNDDANTKSRNSGQSLDDEFINSLVDEALIITGNQEEPIQNTEQLNQKGFWGSSKWTPSGYIKVYDNVKNAFIPVKGAKVRARRWFIIKSDYTNSSGYFSTGKYRRDVNYSIKWETTQYDIRNNWSIQAYYNGPKKRGSWNLNISSGKSLRYATIHRAAHRYHYENIGGLKRPNVWRRLKINYIDKEGTGVNWGNNWQMFVPGRSLWPNIKIWGINNNGNYRTTDDVFSTTIHELGHASHIQLMNGGLIQYSQVSKQIYESWANAIEWYITKIEYNELGVSNYDDPSLSTYKYNSDNMQDWTSSDNHNYTPLFVDLVDNYNQSLNYGYQPTNKCPNGGNFDGYNCRVGTPPSGSNAFIWADNFYYTGPNCPMKGSSFNGANCFVQNIPNGSIGFIWNNNWYLHPAGNSNYPYDQVSGYTMGNIEQLLKHSYGLTSLKNQLKANKPSNMTDKHIDVYLNYFFNL